MIEFRYLATLYAESRLQYEWHDDACACSEFPEKCGTYSDSEYYWRRGAPMSWNAEALTDKVLEFVEMTKEGSPEQAVRDFEQAALNRVVNGERIEDDLLIFYVYPPTV